jgi:hypothetical protein
VSAEGLQLKHQQLGIVNGSIIPNWKCHKNTGCTLQQCHGHCIRHRQAFLLVMQYTDWTFQQTSVNHLQWWWCFKQQSDQEQHSARCLEHVLMESRNEPHDNTAMFQPHLNLCSLSEQLQYSAFWNKAAPTKIGISVAMRKNSTYSGVQLHMGQEHVMNSGSQLSITQGCMCENGYSLFYPCWCCLVQMEFKTGWNHSAAQNRAGKSTQNYPDQLQTPICPMKQHCGHNAMHISNMVQDWNMGPKQSRQRAIVENI